MKLSKEERKRIIDEPGMNWRDWGRFVLLKYWYIFFSFLTDIGIPIQYLENYELVGNRIAYYEMIISLMMEPLLIYAELRIYKILFPREKDTID
jgi:hypothetical protein